MIFENGFVYGHFNEENYSAISSYYRQAVNEGIGPQHVSPDGSELFLIGMLFKPGQAVASNVVRTESQQLATRFAINKVQGKAWEGLLKKFSAQGWEVAERVSVRAIGETGRTVADLLLYNPKTGKYIIIEAKSSATASFTKRQIQHLPLIGRSSRAELIGKKGLRLKEGLKPGDLIPIYRSGSCHPSEWCYDVSVTLS